MEKYYQLSTIFQQIETEEKHPNSFCEASITVIPKPHANICKKHTTLAGVAPWIECQCANQRVTESDTCLGCGPGPR